MSTELMKTENSKVIQFNFFDADQFAVMQRVSTMFASSELVPAMYPRLREWRRVRDRVDPDRLLQSDLARRLGLLGDVP